VRHMPWLIRAGLFSVGFGVGLSHYKSTPPQQPVIIQLQIVMPDSSEKRISRDPVSEVSFKRAAGPEATAEAVTSRSFSHKLESGELRRQD